MHEKTFSGNIWLLRYKSGGKSGRSELDNTSESFELIIIVPGSAMLIFNRNVSCYRNDCLNIHQWWEKTSEQRLLS